MCGIVGYSGKQQAVRILLEGLSALEYRGYDSAGVSVFTDHGLCTTKSAGRLAFLAERLGERPLPGFCGIGHTRWATHGEPSDRNAHPHGTERVSLVHNGIIENYAELKAMLSGKGYVFETQTDTEVAAKTVDYCYDGDPIAAIRKACGMMEGSYAFGVLFADHPGKVYGTRLNSPLLAAVGEGEGFLASDISAVLSYTKNYYALEHGEIVTIDSDGKITVTDMEGCPIEKELLTAQWDVEQAQKNGFDHFMRKEIFEQPTALYNTVHPRIIGGVPDFSHDGIAPGFFKDITRIQMVACGTASYAGCIGKNIIEKLARVPAEVDIASEFRYRDPILDPTQLVVVISQSGETADTLAALRLAKKQGVKTLAIVNVAGSTIAREADIVLYTYAGPEIAVASTKAYSVQTGVLYLLAIRVALEKGRIGEEKAKELVSGLLDAIEKTNAALLTDEAAKAMAAIMKDVEDCFFIGRGADFALCREGSLKLKEISYIHSEAYEAGELKHGTISLITDGVPVIALATQTALLPKTISNIKETRARGAQVLLICKESDEIGEDVYDHIIRLPDLDDLFAPITGVIPLQLMAYHTAVARGCDVDKPRNLAKSVTVE
ncbi:MAG: glutamine--fructose-6-phosphate transaminase (isomerizing) [Oscillospiraceae bacterium]|nr:glutamine--fructose-6-phosphate transaminase (isomerizing) [Oscillospiraceae bacterium]